MPEDLGGRALGSRELRGSAKALTFCEAAIPWLARLSR